MATLLCPEIIAAEYFRVGVGGALCPLLMLHHSVHGNCGSVLSGGTAALAPRSGHRQQQHTQRSAPLGQGALHG